MARKSRVTSRDSDETTITPKDFRYGTESILYWTVMGVVGLAFVIVVGILLMSAKGGEKKQATNWLWLLILLWPVGSFFISTLVPLRRRRKDIQNAGPNARVMGSNHPQLLETLQQQADVLGLDQTPAMYLIDADAPVIYSLPGKPPAIVASKSLRSELNAPEFAALIARQMATIRAGNCKMRLAFNWIRNANPALRLLLFPVYAAGTMLRNWLDLTDYTADRGAVLLTGDESVVNAAILKMAALADQRSDVSSEDVEDYLSGSELSQDSAQVERHYQIGNFIDEEPNLKERIDHIGEYRQSKKGKAAFQKLSEM